MSNPSAFYKENKKRSQPADKHIAELLSDCSSDYSDSSGGGVSESSLLITSDISSEQSSPPLPKKRKTSENIDIINTPKTTEALKALEKALCSSVDGDDSDEDQTPEWFKSMEKKYQDELLKTDPKLSSHEQMLKDIIANEREEIREKGRIKRPRVFMCLSGSENCIVPFELPEQNSISNVAQLDWGSLQDYRNDRSLTDSITELQIKYSVFFPESQNVSQQNPVSKATNNQKDIACCVK